MLLSLLDAARNEGRAPYYKAEGPIQWDFHFVSDNKMLQNMFIIIMTGKRILHSSFQRARFKTQVFSTVSVDSVTLVVGMFTFDLIYWK